MMKIFYFRPFDFHADTREPDRRLRVMGIALPVELEDPETVRTVRGFLIAMNVALLAAVGLGVYWVITNGLPF